jgi:CRP-like cAMP-binding protein
MSGRGTHVSAILRGTRLFGDLSPEQAELLGTFVEPVEFAGGETILHEGEVGEDLFVIERGQAEIRRRDDADRPRVINRLYAGDHFGEIGLLNGIRSADVVAVTPMALYRLTREAYLASLERLAPTIEQELQRVAAERSKPMTRPSETDPAFDRVLERLIQHEIESMQAAEIRGERPTFDEMIEFYARARFLYPEKMGVLRHRYDAVRHTWQRLIEANGDVFNILMLRRPVNGELVATNSICAFEYAPRTWQGQHLVSGERHEYTGTLAALIGLVGGMHDDTCVDFIRLTFRPTNPGVQMLFGGVASALPMDTSHLSTRRYFVTPLPEPRGDHTASPAVDISSAIPGDRGPETFYASSLHPVEVSALRFEDPRLSTLDTRYGAYGLSRRREVLVATYQDQTVGAAISNLSSEGMNFSFLENAVEEVAVDPGLPPDLRTSVLASLAESVRNLYARAGRDYVVWMVDDALADELKRFLGWPAIEDKQYGILTVSREKDSFVLANRFFTDYYRMQLVQDARSVGRA